MTLWFCLSQVERDQVQSINKYFRDMETEWETGVPVLPGWASIGDVAARYGVDDGADPFAAPVDPPRPEDN